MSHIPGDVSTNAFIYFREYKDNEQSLTYPSERLVETVSASVTILDGMMAEVAHTYSVEEKITAAIKNTVDFEWIQSSGCSLQHQEIVDGIVQSVTRISVPLRCKRRNRSLMEESRQKARRRKMKILSHILVGCKVMPLLYICKKKYVYVNIFNH
jgi:hypothetical protein